MLPGTKLQKSEATEKQLFWVAIMWRVCLMKWCQWSQKMVQYY